MTISWTDSTGKSGIAEDDYEFAMQQREQMPEPIKAQARRSGAEDSADVSTYDVPGSDLESKMHLHERYLNYKKQPLQPPYKNLPEQEFKDLLWDTPIASSKGGGPSASDIQDMLNTTDEEHRARYDELNKALGNAGSVLGGVSPSGRIRMRKDLEGFQEYLKNIPPDVSVHDMGDGTVILRKAPSKPPEVASLKEPKVVGEEGVDLSWEKFSDYVHDLRVKFVGEPEKWSTKEHMGQLISNAMSVLGGGARVPKMSMTRLYRAETSTLPGEAPTSVPEWMAQNPEYQNMIKATGRWFTNSKENAQWYVDKMGGKGISYVDVPSSEAQKYLAANHPEAKKYIAAGREGEEYFLPADLASTRSALSELTTETIQQQQQAQHQGSYTERYADRVSTSIPDKRTLGAADYPHVQKAYLEALDKGYTTREQLAAELQVSPETVYRISKKLGIDLREVQEGSSWSAKWTPEKFDRAKELLEQGKSFSAIGRELGLSQQAVSLRFNKEGLQSPYVARIPERETDWTTEKIRQMTHMQNEGASFADIAKEMKLTRGQVAGKLSRLEKNKEEGLTTETIPQQQQANAGSNIYPEGYFEKVSQEQRLSLKGVSHPGYRWEVVDKQTGNVMSEHESRSQANKAVDRRDNKYGGYRYTVQRKVAEELTPEEQTFLKEKNITPQKIFDSKELEEHPGHRPEGDYPPNASAKQKAEWDKYWNTVRDYKESMKGIAAISSIKTNQKALDEWIENGPSSKQIEDRRPGHGGFPPRLPEPDFTSYKPGQLSKDLGFADLTDAKIKQLARNYAKKASKK